MIQPILRIIIIGILNFKEIIPRFVESIRQAHYTFTYLLLIIIILSIVINLTQQIAYIHICLVLNQRFLNFVQDLSFKEKLFLFV